MKKLFLSLMAVLLLSTLYSSSIGKAELQYRSGVIFLWAADVSIQGAVYNTGRISHNARVVIYDTAANPPTVLVDSGNQAVAPWAKFGSSYALPANSVVEYYVEITTDSEDLIPRILVGPGCPGNPCTAPRITLYRDQLTRKEF